MNTQKVRFMITMLFLVAYMALVIIILLAELSDTVNMEQGQNSLMGELKVLLGVLTGAVGQILNYWFSTKTPIETNTAPPQQQSTSTPGV